MNDMRTVDITTETQEVPQLEEGDKLLVVSGGNVKRADAGGIIETMRTTQLYGLYVKDGVLYEGFPGEEEENDG